MLRVSLHAGPIAKISRFNQVAWLDIAYEKLEPIANYKTVLFEAGVGATMPIPLEAYLRLPELLMHACLVRLTGKAEMPPRPALCVPEAVEQDGLRFVPIHDLVEPARTGFLDWLHRFSEEPVEHPAAPQGIVPETLYVKFLTEAV